jgi:hypothetical protein
VVEKLPQRLGIDARVDRAGRESQRQPGAPKTLAKILELRLLDSDLEGLDRHRSVISRDWPGRQQWTFRGRLGTV